MTKQQLLNTYYPVAVAATANSGIFPETLITQLIEESGYNLSTLATQYNNFFGIKATKSFSGPVVSKTTTEYNSNNIPYTVYGSGIYYNNYTQAIQNGEDYRSLFRVYSNPTAGFKGYVSFLQNNPIYTKSGVFDAQTPQEQFKALQKAGYATSSSYYNELINVYNSIKNELPVVAIAGTGGLLLFFIGWGLYKAFHKN